MERKYSMENATIVVNMVIELMNAKRNQNLKDSVTNVKKNAQYIKIQNQYIQSNRANCESNIWLRLQHLV